MRRKLTALTASLAAAFCLSLTLATPAHAAYPYLVICNSGNSVGPIEVTSHLWPAGRKIDRGVCNSFNNENNSVRIDPDPYDGTYPDVDSTRWAYEWQTGYPDGQCWNGEGLIDPPNYYQDEIFFNTDKSYC